MDQKVREINRPRSREGLDLKSNYHFVFCLDSNCLSSGGHDKDVKPTMRWELFPQENISPRAQLARNYGAEITQISCKNYGAQELLQDNLCDVSFTLRHPKLIVQN